MNDGNLRPFTKGDKRINRGGRPKNFDALRELSRTIAHEVARKPDGEPLAAGGHAMTVVEAILRQWAQSKNPALQIRFMEICYGKVPDKVEFAGKDDGSIPLKIKMVWGDTQMDSTPNPNAIDYRKNLAALAPLDDE